MGRESILGNARKERDSTTTDTTPEEQAEDPAPSESQSATTQEPEENQDGKTERVKFSQRCEPDLLERVEEYQKDMRFPSRNFAINYLLEEALEENGY